jgi:hypothetical protein
MQSRKVQMKAKTNGKLLLVLCVLLSLISCRREAQVDKRDGYTFTQYRRYSLLLDDGSGGLGHPAGSKVCVHGVNECFEDADYLEQQALGRPWLAICTGESVWKFFNLKTKSALECTSCTAIDIDCSNQESMWVDNANALLVVRWIEETQRTKRTLYRFNNNEFSVLHQKELDFFPSGLIEGKTIFDQGQKASWVDCSKPGNCSQWTMNLMTGEYKLKALPCDGSQHMSVNKDGEAFIPRSTPLVCKDANGLAKVKVGTYAN